MKNNNTINQPAKQDNRPKGNRTAPDVRDNLDSRKKEEQDVKGDDITHNRKSHHNKPHNQKNNK
jgi:hypothetical protein